MDRRQRKTKDAIFKAFIQLLSKKSYNNITVGEIIDLANVGRATFYAHFETKEFLLKELCKELFDHVFNANKSESTNNLNIFNCEDKDDVFLHLFKHIKKNDNNIGKLLSSKNNDLFLEYFKNGVRELVEKNINDFKAKKPSIVPSDFWVNHIMCTFIESLRWWLNNKMKYSPEEITEYFMQVI